ncbi:MAG TPA: hemerythrin domain-containing protein [Nocardioidaceae bacterium]|nr:hemerythrin domain-containing protein [Nocardioidaceae bacterium]
MADGDVVTLIEHDHREIERLFDELGTDRDDRPQLLEKIAALFVAHSRAEEAEVYPVAREETGEQEVEHSAEEHAEAERMLQHLRSLDPAGAEFDEHLATLVDAVTHHVNEEEATVLPGLAARVSRDRLVELGSAFESRKLHELQQNPHH